MGSARTFLGESINLSCSLMSSLLTPDILCSYPCMPTRYGPRPPPNVIPATHIPRPSPSLADRRNPWAYRQTMANEVRKISERAANASAHFETIPMKSVRFSGQKRLTEFRRDPTIAWRPETPLVLSMMSVCRGTASAVGPSRGNNGRRGYSSIGLRQSSMRFASPTWIRGPDRSSRPLGGSPPPGRRPTYRHTRPGPCMSRTFSAFTPQGPQGCRLRPAAPRRATAPGYDRGRGHGDFIGACVRAATTR